MSPAQAHHAVNALMADSERVTDAVMALVDHAHANGLCPAVALGWVNRLFSTIETRMAEHLMSQDEHEHEDVEPVVFMINPDLN